MSNYWDAGAHSLLKLEKSGWFSFVMPQKVGGAVVGLSLFDEVTSPEEITHGLAFSGARFSVVEDYVPKRADEHYADLETFHIARIGARVFYCRGNTPTKMPGGIIMLPGEVIHTSDVLVSTAPIYLDASLLVPGDSVLAASMTNIQADAYGYVEFEPMSLFASQSTQAFAMLYMEPMETSGYGYEVLPGLVMTVAFPSFISGEFDGEVVPSFQMVEDELIIDSEDVDANTAPIVTDVLWISGEPIPSREGYLLVESTISILDGVMLGGGFTLADELIVDDLATSSSTAMVADELVIIGEPEAGTVVSATSVMVADELIIDGDGAFLSIVIEESLVEIDDATMQAGGQVIDDELIIDDEATTETRQRMAMVTDDLVIDDEAMVRVDSLAMVEDVLVISDDPLLRGQGLIAWVLNTETSGVAWYENWEFTGMAQLADGRVLAIGPAGLALLGGDTDAGLDIDADIVLGYTDFSGYTQSGRPKNDQFMKQHVLSIFVGYRADGVLDATVQTHGNRTYTYKLEKQPAKTVRNSRFKPGKGLNERFWALSFGNVAGCDFEINSMAADAVPNKTRRI